MPPKPTGQQPQATSPGTAQRSPAPTPSPSPAPPDLNFGSHLEPALLQACDNRLSMLRWFRTSWQRGGALTGYAIYRDANNHDHHVVVKLPVPPAERQWLINLQHGDDVCPRLLAQGQSLDQYDLAWVVMECLPHGPLSDAWQGQQFNLLTAAAARFYAATTQTPVTQPPTPEDWPAAYKRARDTVRQHNLPNSQRWNKALKAANRKLPEWLNVWNDRPTNQWCHGDLHLGNAMTRNEPPDGPALLLDFALVRPGHWVEDAVYLERLYWGRTDRLAGCKICKQLAHERKNLGLPVAPDWPRLATVRRALLAMATPLIPQHRADPTHLNAALETLESHTR